MPQKKKPAKRKTTAKKPVKKVTKKVATKRKPSKQQKKKRSLKKKLFLFGLKWSSVFGIWFAIIAIGIIIYYAHDLPEISRLGKENKKASITIETEDGSILASYGDLYGDYVSYHEFPESLIDAVIATEDRRFFSHFGIDIIGISRAMYKNWKAGYIVQGGSTISQQLAKVLFLTSERTFRRKFQELILALWLEFKYSKEEILTIYLNKVYLGAGNYGIDAASRYYFDKDVFQLTLKESAILAGLLKAPTRYAPSNHPEQAEKRAQQVLLNMEAAGFINGFDVEKASYTPVYAVTKRHHKLRNPYFTDWILEQIPNYIGNVDFDLVVTTTLNKKIQTIAEANLNHILDSYGEERDASQGAVVVLNPQGEILAMVGGRSYRKSQFNRVTKAQRQPGSAFKIFTYLAAFEQDIKPNETMFDQPIDLNGWQPKNYKEEFLGEMQLNEAFYRSINTIAVQLSEKVGRYQVIDMAKRLGVDSRLKSHPSLALGANEVNLLEMTRAYAHLANLGKRVHVTGIKEIRDKDDFLIYRRAEAEEPARVLSKAVTAKMNYLLTQVVSETHGTGKKARLTRQTAGKTGTSQDSRDAWFIGFTPEYVTGVWVGNDDNSPMQYVTGGTLPAMVWKGTMQEVLKGKPKRSIPTSTFAINRHEVFYNSRTGRSVWSEWFK